MKTVRNIPADINSGICNLNKSSRDSVDTLLYTKYTIPSPPLDCIGRIQLISRLGEITNKKLTLISAPAGYGKTTLLSIWLSRKGINIQTAWVSLNDNDNNLHTFWQYILMAIEKSISGALENYESVDYSIMKYSIDIILNEFINRLSSVNDVIVLVFDDYHVIYEESIHDSLQYFINHLPLNVHVVITSRNIPPLKVAKLRSQGNLLELKTQDLKLNFSEVSEFLTRIMKLSMDESEVKKLEEWTEGWIAALNLAALTIKNGSDGRRYINDNSHINDYLVEYMSEEVFDQQEEDIKEFLVKTSILDTLNSTLCNAVVGISNSMEIISILVKNNIFINAIGNKKNNYRYHSLFSGFLKNKLIEMYPDELEELYLKASKCYEENNMVKEALAYSVRSGNYQHTVGMIEKYGEIMIIYRDSMILAETIESLPRHIIKKNIKLIVLYTLAVVGKNISDGNGIFVGNEYISLENEIFHKYKAELLMIRMVLAYTNEDFITAIDYGKEVIKNLSEESNIKCMPYKVLTRIYCIAGNSKEAKSYLDFYINAIKSKNYFDDFFIDKTYVRIMGQILCGEGKYKDSLDMFKEFDKKLTADKMTVPAITNLIYLNLGYLYFELGDLELSRISIEKCIKLSSIKMDIFRLISCYVLVARINCSMGNYDNMMLSIKKAEDLCDRYNLKFMVIRLIIYIVRTLLAAGEIKYADYLIIKYDIRVHESFDVAYEDSHLALTDLYIARGELDNAKIMLDRLYREISGTKRNFSYVRVMILKSLLSKRRGNKAEAIKYMKEAIERASGQGYISTFSEFGEPIAEIILALLNNAEEMDFMVEKYIDYIKCILSDIKESSARLDSVNPELLKNLTRREMEILNCIQYGLSNKDIAAKLFVAESTVKKHINNIYRKISVANRKQAIYFMKSQYNILLQKH